jgi:carbonic anhydrase
MPKQDEMDFESYVSEHIVPEVSKAAKVPLLLLQCMDSRYPRRILETMDSLGLRGKYDQLVLAGASLGVVHKETWRDTFFDHLEFAMKEHDVSQVLILDHRDCGAYKKFLGVGPDDPKKEKDKHVEIYKEAVTIITRKFPSLRGKVRGLLLPIELVEELG